MALTAVFSDIHGCLDEFDALRALIGLKKGVDRVVLLGDLTDRGPDSRGCVLRAIEMGDEVLASNHEAKHLAFRDAYRAWQKNPKPDLFPTLLNETQIKTHFSIKQPEWDWLANCPYTAQITPQVVAVHAGFQPARSLDEQTPSKLLRIRYVNKQGLWGDHSTYICPEKGYFWAEGWKGPESVIYGHTTFRNPRLDRYTRKGQLVSWCLGIDTGCVYGDKLSALVFTDDLQKAPELVQVQAKKAYYVSIVTKGTNATSRS